MRALGKAAVAVVLVCAAALSLLGLEAAFASSQSVSSDVAGCVIRLYPSGPRVHVDKTHTCPYVTDVRVRDGVLQVERGHAESIQAAVVSPDETLSARGILAGASWARGRTLVRFYDTRADAPIPADDPRLTGSTANIWLVWVS